MTCRNGAVPVRSDRAWGKNGTFGPGDRNPEAGGGRGRRVEAEWPPVGSDRERDVGELPGEAAGVDEGVRPTEDPPHDLGGLSIVEGVEIHGQAGSVARISGRAAGRW